MCGDDGVLHLEGLADTMLILRRHTELVLVTLREVKHLVCRAAHKLAAGAPFTSTQILLLHDVVGDRSSSSLLDSTRWCWIRYIDMHIILQYNGYTFLNNKTKK